MTKPSDISPASKDAQAEPSRRPAWLETLVTGLPIHTHFAMSGNIRDLFPVYNDNTLEFLNFDSAVSWALKQVNVETVLTYDPIAGLSNWEGIAPEIRAQLEKYGVHPSQEHAELGQLESVIGAVAQMSTIPIALIVNYSSHLVGLDDAALERLLVITDKLSSQPNTRKNAVIWVLDRPGDLPDWFVVGNHNLRQIRVDLPDLEDRFLFAKGQSEKFCDFDQLPPAEQTIALQKFALKTEGMTLMEIAAVSSLAAQQQIGLINTDDAIRIYRTGIRRNPWKSPVLMARLKQGREILAKRIKGQNEAITKAVEILVRSAVGLSGSQTSNRLNRPRGVMFFVGPTGVGKTELAKAITELLFGDDALCQRFDMTEFSSERSLSRLIGAPPGYSGHELGGELTNALQRRPFSVILFDEIEKAHPRVLDMFMQILDEGRLTDSRGETSYFSDAFIIFTSNIGMLGKHTETNLGFEVLPSDTHAELQSKLLEGVRKYFVEELRRPELLNRIGQNVVAFDFIQFESAQLIFELILNRILNTVKIEHGVSVIITPEALDTLSGTCIADWANGGRGIANRIETYFINPLAEILLDQAIDNELTVKAIEIDGGRARLIVQ